MELIYEFIPDNKAELCRDLCNELMTYQKSIAYIKPELFDSMNFDTRMIPSISHAEDNFIVVVKDGEKLVGYVYANISPKEAYNTEFATFFDMNSVKKKNVGCLSQFYIKEDYRKYGVGSRLFDMSLQWLKQHEEVEDYFIYVSNGNESGLNFYKRKGFNEGHQILDGFITVLRSSREELIEANSIKED